MTVVEVLGGVLGTLAAAGTTYGVVVAKLNSIVGKKEASGDDSLRDLVLKLDGKLDAHHEQNSANFRELDKRLSLVEARVFTPPQRQAYRIAKGSE